MESPKVSIIVPAYNAGPYIRECLGSIAAQTYRNLEVIVVDDASTDDSAAIAGEFCAGDPRFRLLRAQHGGLSATRNRGIEVAEGEWLLFVDSDDCLQPWAVERLASIARTSGAPIVIGEMSRGMTFETHPAPPERFEIWSRDEALRIALYQKEMINHACGVLYRRGIVTAGGAFREGILYEDLDSFYRFFGQTDRIAWTPAQVYFYRRTPGSIVNTWKPARLDVLDVTDRILGYMKERHPGLVRAAEDRRFSAHFNMLALMLKSDIKNPEAIRRCLGVIREYRGKSITDPNVRLKNKLGAIASFGGVGLLRLLARRMG